MTEFTDEAIAYEAAYQPVNGVSVSREDIRLAYMDGEIAALKSVLAGKTVAS